MKYNCAQTVAAAAGRADLVNEMAQCGGGKAPEGLCGALYAAIQAAPEDKKNLIREKFNERLGAVTCSDLKNVRKVPCPLCVETAAKLLGEVLD